MQIKSMKCIIDILNIKKTFQINERFNENKYIIELNTVNNGSKIGSF